MKENKRINNLDKNNTRFSIRKYQGYGATSVAIIGFIIISCFNEAKADSDKYEIRSHQQSMTNHLTTHLTIKRTPQIRKSITKIMIYLN